MTRANQRQSVRSGSADQAVQIVLWHRGWGLTAAATNIDMGEVVAPNDADLRLVVDLRGMTCVKLQGRLSSNVAQNKLGVQYSTNMNFSAGGGHWIEMVSSKGNHTGGVTFWTAEYEIPDEAQKEEVMIRPVIMDGDGAADPAIGFCILNVSPSTRE
jgi:hypothetical protein